MIERNDDTRPRDDAASLRRDLIAKLYFELAKFPEVATRNDQFLALSFAVRDRLLHRWVESSRTYLEGKHRSVIYLSAEFLIGPQLGANLLALGLEAAARTALGELGLSLDELIEHEEEPGLGNGGLGRLAACYIESLATLDIPAIGHGLRYEFGIFDQGIRAGWRVGRTDRWLRTGTPGRSAGSRSSTRSGSVATPSTPAISTAGCASTGSPSGGSRASRTTSRSRATARRPPASCGCGARWPTRNSTSTRSRSASTGARSTRRSAARP